MNPILCITIRFIQPFPVFHGSGDGGVPEWPPSPMRTFQALVNAASLRYRGLVLPVDVESALALIESIRPSIIAPDAFPSTVGYRAYVPHNQADLVSAAWHRGNIEASIASHRMEKDIRPMRIACTGEAMPALHYLFPLDRSIDDCQQLLNVIRPCVRSISSLGWGIDLVAADATLLNGDFLPNEAGHRWQPASKGQYRLRVPRRGSLHSLRQRHDRFLHRIVGGQFNPVPPVTAVDVITYARDTDSVSRPYAIFKLLDVNEDTYRYPHAKFMHIAGMVRHAAIEIMKKDPPHWRQNDDAWVENFICGHRGDSELPHHQLSYVPLASIGHEHADALIRNVMIIAPFGFERELEYLAQRLDGYKLTPEYPIETITTRPTSKSPSRISLERFTPPPHKFIRQSYLGTSKEWATVTPAILPGHDDHKPAKTEKLILKALAQSGIDQPCEFIWSAIPNFKNCLTAYKYDRQKRRTGYYRPDHLENLTAVHLRLTFEQPVSGPLVIGAGRHHGFGLCAST